MELAHLPPLRRAFRPEIRPDPLRDQLASLIEQTAVALLDPARIEALAEDAGIVRRHRVHHAGLVVCSLILSALQRSTDTQGRWLDAQRTYEAIGGCPSGATSFRNNVRRMAPVMHRLLRERLTAMCKAAEEVELRGRLKMFRDVLIPDGCAFKLACALAGAYSGTGQPAELKLHAVYSVRAHGVIALRSSPGSVHDNDGFHPGRWERDALYIWDLGFNDYDRVVRATRAGAHVLQRLKSGANPVVLASYGPAGERRALAHDDGRPMDLETACAVGLVHQQQALDLDVQLIHERQSATLRAVCVPFAGEDRYYLTSLPRAIFSPYDIAELYRIRWEIELFFRGWKGAVRLDEVSRLRNDGSLHAAVLAALLATALAQRIHLGLQQLAEAKAAQDAAFPP